MSHSQLECCRQMVCSYPITGWLEQCDQAFGGTTERKDGRPLFQACGSYLQE